MSLDYLSINLFESLVNLQYVHDKLLVSNMSTSWIIRIIT